MTKLWPLRAGESYSFGKLSVSLDKNDDDNIYKLRLKDEKVCALL